MKAPVSNPNFVTWFSGSKVVDESGAPRVVYHGTYVRELGGRVVMGDIEAFDRMVSVNIVRRKPSIDTVGVWFSTNPGKDGIRIVKGDSTDSTEFDAQDAWIALEPTQIKSAISNSGRYDPNCPDMTDGAAAAARELLAPSVQVQDHDQDARQAPSFRAGKDSAVF